MKPLAISRSQAEGGVVTTARCTWWDTPEGNFHAGVALQKTTSLAPDAPESPESRAELGQAAFDCLSEALHA